MTPSIDERREAAQRLRLMEPGEVNWDALAGAVFADGRPHMRVNVAGRLADLIDPSAWERTVEDNHRLLDRCRELERELAEVKAAIGKGIDQRREND